MSNKIVEEKIAYYLDLMERMCDLKKSINDTYKSKNNILELINENKNFVIEHYEKFVQESPPLNKYQIEFYGEAYRKLKNKSTGSFFDILNMFWDNEEDLMLLDRLVLFNIYSIKNKLKELRRDYIKNHLNDFSEREIKIFEDLYESAKKISVQEKGNFYSKKGVIEKIQKYNIIKSFLPETFKLINKYVYDEDELEEKIKKYLDGNCDEDIASEYLNNSIEKFLDELYSDMIFPARCKIEREKILKSVIKSDSEKEFEKKLKVEVPKEDKIYDGNKVGIAVIENKQVDREKFSTILPLLKLVEESLDGNWGGLRSSLKYLGEGLKKYYDSGSEALRYFSEIQKIVESLDKFYRDDKKLDRSEQLELLEIEKKFLDLKNSVYKELFVS